MAFSSAALAAGYQTAVSDSIPLFVGDNVLRHASVIQWHTSDVTIAGVALSDHPNANELSVWVADGRPWVQTRPNEVTAAQRSWVYAALNASYATIDTVGIQLLNQGCTSITVQVADDFSDATNVTTIASWSTVAAYDRVFNCSLADAFTQYTAVPEVRIGFVTSASQVPRIGQIFLGQRRQLSRGFLLSYDAQPLGADRDFGTTKGHAMGLRENFSGNQDLGGSYLATTTTTDSLYGINDTTTIRTLYSDCVNGSELVLYVADPQNASDTLSHDIRFGMLDKDLRLEVTGPYTREWSFSFTEVPPFWENT